MPPLLTRAILEIACFNAEGAIVAALSGANRIELGEDYSCGGLTPSLSSFLKTQSRIQIPIHVLIRNRPGNFFYDKKDIQNMEISIREFNQSDADGFVFGALNQESMPDENACKLLLENAAGKPCIFHRAFDEVSNQEKALEQLQHWGFAGVLTSGGPGNAKENTERLIAIQSWCEPNFQLIVGGGVRSDHLESLASKLQAPAYHSAAILKNASLPDAEEIKRLISCIN